ncbi:MAG: CPXCG motif-containing cysteine-rich protein [Nitrospinaceae bacterium]
MEEVERYFACPYCGESISMLLDVSAREQQYIEDCEVCCRPIEIYFIVEESMVRSWNASRTDS